MARSRLRHYYRHGLLPQLVAFEACARLGSVTRAAEELALAQPTVSGLLKKLSDTLGGTVLTSRNGRMELTETGREAMRLCYDVITAIDRYEERKGRTESFSLGVRGWMWGAAASPL